MFNNIMAFAAKVNEDCQVQKVLKSITTDLSTLVPALVARVGAGFITEIPAYYIKLK